jgi:phosphoglycolate phosphatase
MAWYFFDLDGTLVDSREGLFGAFRAGLRAVGAPPQSDQALQGFLGTPLPAMFATVVPDISAQGTAAGITAFRANYEADGIEGNAVYPGVLDMLAAVARGGHGALVVTSKPQPHAERVVEASGLGGFMRGVVGAGLAETDTKTELVARALALAGAKPAETVMLGDRFYDVVGARENGVTPVGALWGYGSRAELAEYGCRYFAESAAGFTRDFVEGGVLAGRAVRAA